MSFPVAERRSRWSKRPAGDVNRAKSGGSNARAHSGEMFDAFNSGTTGCP